MLREQQMLVTYAPNKSWLFWLREKPEDPNLSIMPGSNWRRFWDLFRISVTPNSKYSNSRTAYPNRHQDIVLFQLVKMSDFLFIRLEFSQLHTAIQGVQHTLGIAKYNRPTAAGTCCYINILKKIGTKMLQNGDCLASYCVSQKERERGNQRLYLKTCPPYLRFYTTPWAVCVRKSCKLIKQFWRCGFECGHKKKLRSQNLELLLDAAAWFRKIPCNGRTLNIMNYTNAKLWNTMWLNSDQWWRRCHLHT